MAPLTQAPQPRERYTTNQRRHLGINTWHKPIRGQYLGHVNNMQPIRGRHLGHVVITILYISITCMIQTPGTLSYMIRNN